MNTVSQRRFAVLLFILASANALFWIIAFSIDVYKYALIGGLFEILWLPGILITFLAPFAAAYLWYKEKFSLRSINLITILITIAGFVLRYTLATGSV